MNEWQPDPTLPVFIVCAAMRHKKTGRIITGARHYDKIMQEQINASEGKFNQFCRKMLSKPLRFFHIYIHMNSWGNDSVEQGFIDQFCRFVTREEAWKIADKQGQIRRQTGFEKHGIPRKPAIGDEGKLFSENLY